MAIMIPILFPMIFFAFFLHKFSTVTFANTWAAKTQQVASECAKAQHLGCLEATQPTEDFPLAIQVDTAPIGLQ